MASEPTHDGVVDRETLALSYVVFGRTPFDAMALPWHFLARHLARRHRVAYVLDPVRPFAPRPAPGSVPPGVSLVVPTDYPLQRFRSVRRKGLRAAARRIRDALPADRSPLVAVVYPFGPLDTALALEPDRIAYVASDDNSVDSGDGSRPNEKFLAWERHAFEVADLIVPIAEVHVGRLRDYHHSRVRLIPAAYDDELYDGETRPPPAGLQGLPRPILGFCGTVRASRLDVDLVLRAAEARPGASFVFVGPVVVSRGATMAPLRRLPNVHFLACSSSEEVPAWILGFDVVIAPYRNHPGNRGFYPLKVLDALAMGRHAVLTPPAGLTELSPHVHVAGDTTSFLLAIDAALSEGNRPETAERRRQAVRHRAFSRWVTAFEAEVLDALR